jgi:hypothetical protein
MSEREGGQFSGGERYLTWNTYTLRDTVWKRRASAPAAVAHGGPTPIFPYAKKSDEAPERRDGTDTAWDLMRAESGDRRREPGDRHRRARCLWRRRFDKRPGKMDVSCQVSL